MNDIAIIIMLIILIYLCSNFEFQNRYRQILIVKMMIDISSSVHRI